MNMHVLEKLLVHLQIGARYEVVEEKGGIESFNRTRSPKKPSRRK